MVNLIPKWSAHRAAHLGIKFNLPRALIPLAISKLVQPAGYSKSSRHIFHSFCFHSVQFSIHRGLKILTLARYTHDNEKKGEITWKSVVADNEKKTGNTFPFLVVRHRVFHASSPFLLLSSLTCQYQNFKPCYSHLLVCFTTFPTVILSIRICAWILSSHPPILTVWNFHFIDTFLFSTVLSLFSCAIVSEYRYLKFAMNFYHPSRFRKVSNSFGWIPNL